MLFIIVLGEGWVLWSPALGFILTRHLTWPN